MEFKISSIREEGQNTPEPSKSEFLENFVAIDFVLSDAEDSTSRLFNRGDISDLILLRTILAI